MTFDIAVLELEEIITGDRFKRVILSLPPLDNTPVRAVGYGALNNDGKSARRIMTVNVVYRRFDWCRKNEESEGGLSKACQICAIFVGYPEGNTQTCYGDSGRPLYKIRNAMRLQPIGVTSFFEHWLC